MPDPRPSLRDIARELGVSTMTVSRAQGGRPGVSPELRDELRRKAEQLGYRPDPTIDRLMSHIRSRRRSTVRAVIVAVTDIAEADEPAYCERLRRHAAARARELGFAFSVLRARPDTGGWPALRRTLHARGVDGVLLLPMSSPISLHAQEWSHFSIVAATSSIVAPSFHRVTPDHLANAALVVSRLVERGHRRLGFVGTTTHSERTRDAFPSALAWHHTRLGLRCVPLVHPPTETPKIAAWVRKERPEVIVVGRPGDLPGFQSELARARLRVAWCLAGILSDHPTHPGLDERHDLIGAAAIDTLAGLVVRADHGTPLVPATVSIVGTWRGEPARLS